MVADISVCQVGMGVGSLSMIVPMYVAECSPPETRGLLIGVQQFAIEFGIMISFWIVSCSLLPPIFSGY